MKTRGPLDLPTSEILGMISELEATPLSTANSVYGNEHLWFRLLFSRIFVLSIGKANVSIAVGILYAGKMSLEELYVQ